MWNEIDAGKIHVRSFTFVYLSKLDCCFAYDLAAKLITATNFCQRGKYAVIGTYDGRCIFYDTEVSK